MCCYAINDLPTEILTKVFVKIKSIDKSNDLCSCLEYTPQIRHFVANLNSQNTTLIRSLTLSVHQPAFLIFSSKSARRSNFEIERELLSLELILANLNGLLSFSLILDMDSYTHHTRALPYEVSTSCIAEFLGVLPASYVNLEIDTRDYGHAVPTATGLARGPNFRVCDKIRSLLPRMHYARIRLTSRCPALLGTLTTDRRTSFNPIKLPADCGERNLQLNRYIATVFMGSHGRCFTATCLLSKCMSRIREAAHSFSSVKPHSTQLDQHDTIIINEVLSCTSRAYPVVKLSGDFQSSVRFMRIEKIEGVVRSSDGYEKVAERRIRRHLVPHESVRDARLPFDMAKKEAEPMDRRFMPERLPRELLGKSYCCALLTNEAVSGRILLDVELRHDPKTYLDLVPIVETPRRWYGVCRTSSLF
ncbi:hypothetical protein AAE478_002650 [Parahypoxylon ruwenzoriense]